MALLDKYTTDEEIEEMRKLIRSEKERQSGRGSKQPCKMRLLKLAGLILFYAFILLLSITVVSVSLARNRGEIPDIMGFNFFVVESGSMEPTFDIGTVIICRRPGDPGKLKAGDIVTFRNLSGFIVTHRIVEVLIDESGKVSYRTKGDNPKNSVDPEILTPDRVISVFVARVPLT